MFTMFYFFFSNSSYFELIDFMYGYNNTHEVTNLEESIDEKNNVVK